MGSPHVKYSSEIHKKIVAGFRAGYSKTMAFRLAGIHPDTGWDWLRLGRQQPDKYPQFVQLQEDIGQAIAEVQAEHVDALRAAGKADPKHWTANAWYLERTDPESWGRRDRVELGTGGSAPLVQLNQLVLIDPDVREQARELLQRTAAPGVEFVRPPLPLGVSEYDEDDLSPRPASLPSPNDDDA